MVDATDDDAATNCVADGAMDGVAARGSVAGAADGAVVVVVDVVSLAMGTAVVATANAVDTGADRVPGADTNVVCDRVDDGTDGAGADRMIGVATSVVAVNAVGGACCPSVRFDPVTGNVLARRRYPVGAAEGP